MFQLKESGCFYRIVFDKFIESRKIYGFFLYLVSEFIDSLSLCVLRIYCSGNEWLPILFQRIKQIMLVNLGENWVTVE